LVEKLKKRNLPAKVHAVEGSSGKVYRVTVGSGLDRDHAEKIQKQLSAKDGVNGVILQNR
jgi:cell division septation protein DedD